MKHALRKEILALRVEMNATERAKKDASIFKKLTHTVFFRKSKIIFCYVSKANEVDSLKIINNYAKKKTLVVPKVSGENLELFRLEHVDHLEKGSFGVMEPNHRIAKKHVGEIDLAIVPGVVFDKRGHRIGYGKGYFDRFLKNLKCPKIGLAYEFQIIDKIPEDPYDVPVDFIITEKNIYDVSAKK